MSASNDVRVVKVGNVSVGGGTLAVAAGPCVLDTFEEALAIAKAAIERECGVPPETLDAEYRLDMELCLLSLRSAEKERVWCVDFRRLDPASGSWELCYSAQVMAEDGAVCHAGDNGGNG